MTDQRLPGRQRQEQPDGAQPLEGLAQRFQPQPLQFALHKIGRARLGGGGRAAPRRQAANRARQRQRPPAEVFVRWYAGAHATA